MIISISVTEAKREMSSLLDRVSRRGERVIITSQGKPKAALVSIEDLRQLQLIIPGVHWLGELNEKVNRGGGGDSTTDGLCARS